MKNVFLIIFFLVVSSMVFSQTTDTLIANRDAGLTSHDGENSANNNYGYSPHISGFAIPGTTTGLLINRNLLGFDLSSIPANVIVDSAFIYLFATNENLFPQFQNGHFGNNSCYLRRVTSSWNEFLVTFNTAPTSTTQNQAILQASDSAYQDYKIDVTNLLQDMIDNPNQSHGFILGLLDESPDKNLEFQSTNGSDTNKYPKLVITYTECREYNLIANRDAGLTSHDGENSANNNYGNSPHISGFATPGTTQGILKNRNLVDFDFSQIPQGAIVDSAFMYLYASGANLFPQFQNGHFGNNSCYLRRVTSPWNEHTVTYNTAPTSTSQHEVILPTSDSAYQDYVVDVTAMVQQIVNDPSQSHGFILGLIDETPNKNLEFQSINGPDSSKFPTLRIKVNCGEITSLDESPKPSHGNTTMDIYPNPTNDLLNIKFIEHDSRTIEIYSIDGKLINSFGNSEQLIQLDVSSYSKGLYLIRSTGEKGIQLKKFIVK